MESVYLKTLIEVARTGSLTKAADTLCVTQSAVSRRIKFLEDQYGMSLLDRSGSVLIVTSVGEMVLEKAEKILQLERELMSTLSGMEKKRPLIFACTPAFGTVYLPEILREYMLSQTGMGDLKFILDTPENIVTGLRKGLYEMAVIEHSQGFNLSEFDNTPLSGDEMVFAAAPGLGLPTQVTMDQLFQLTFYGRQKGCCSRTMLENNLARMDRSLDEFSRIVIYDDLHVIVQALLNGDGIAFISSDIVKKHVAAGTLQMFHVAGFVYQRQRTYISSLAESPSSQAKQFNRKILEYFDHFARE